MKREAPQPLKRSANGKPIACGKTVRKYGITTACGYPMGHPGPHEGSRS